MNRRQFIQRALLGTTGLGLFGGFYSWQIEPFWIEFVRQKMPVINLPNHLIGKTLIQISDIHIGNRFDYSYIIDAFGKAQELEPDFVVYTGDYVTYESKEQFSQLDDVLAHAVTGKMGTAAVLGNHDYGKNWSQQSVASQITMQLENYGITVLKDRQESFNGLTFIGFDDYWGPNFTPEAVLNEYDPSKATVVLCHNPDVCDLDVWSNYNGWILSGHTHGGQCKPPFLPPPLLPVMNERYASGQIDLSDGRTLYVNRALGHLFQVRFNVRPEITVFELEQA